MRDKLLTQSRRIVVKIGSSLVASRDGGLRVHQIASITKDLAHIQETNRQIVIVSSGAIVAGIQRLGFSTYPNSIPLKQAAAAVGQSRLIRAYENAFEKTGDKVAQILLTHDDLADRKRFLNARHTLTSLMKYGVIPIINENDSVSVDEIRFGDNDSLAGQVAHLIDADLLVILSDVSGLYSADPRLVPSAELIPVVTKFTKSIEQAAGQSRNQESRGGMITKIKAAKHVGRFGVSTLLLSGEKKGLLPRVLRGECGGTFFLPHKSPLSSRKQWIAYTLRAKGQLVLDQGAIDALQQRGKSLLPSGILDVTGHFKAGDPVACTDKKGKEFAKGLVNYAAPALHQIKGYKTRDIKKLFGHREYEEVIHRDNLVLL